MANAGDISKRLWEIEDLVGEGDHKKGFLRAIDFAREFAPSSDLRIEAVTLSGQYNTIQQSLRRDSLTQDQYLIQLRTLTRKMLEMLNEIVDSSTQGEAA